MTTKQECVLLPSFFLASAWASAFDTSVFASFALAAEDDACAALGSAAASFSLNLCTTLACRCKYSGQSGAGKNVLSGFVLHQHKICFPRRKCLVRTNGPLCCSLEVCLAGDVLQVGLEGGIALDRRSCFSRRLQLHRSDIN